MNETKNLSEVEEQERKLEQEEIARLKEDCLSWSVFDWENHLKSIDSESSEVLLGNKIDQFTECALRENYSLRLNPEEIKGFSFVTDMLLKKLTDRQAEIIKLVFWEGKSLNTISKELKIRKSAVQGLRDRGLENIKIMLQAVYKARGQKNYSGLIKLHHSEVSA
jgi:DNA-directed RNA polymerase specialized sigma subunit